MRKYVFVATGIALLVTSCGTPEPKAVKTPSYPASQYLTAKGTGQSESEARNQAVAEMSRIFESRVYSDTMDRVKSVVKKTGREFSEQSVESNVRVISEVELKGVTVDDIRRDAKTGMYNALAVLDRFQARDDWVRKIRDVDRKIEGEFNLLENNRSLFVAYRTNKNILKLWLEREVLVSRVKVLGFDHGTSSSYDIRKVFHALPEIKNSMNIYVSIAGQDAEDLKDAISAALSDSGFVLTGDGNRADVRVVGDIAVEAVDLKNPGWKFARATVSLSVIDSKTNMTVGEIAENKRAGHLTYEEAVHKAIQQVSGPASEKVLSFFEE